MPEYDNTNQFAFFKQTSKKNEKAPDYSSTGQYAIELGDDLVEYIKSGGRNLEVAGWKRESASGIPFISCRLSKPYVPAGTTEDEDF